MAGNYDFTEKSFGEFVSTSRRATFWRGFIVGSTFAWCTLLYIILIFIGLGLL